MIPGYRLTKKIYESDNTIIYRGVQKDGDKPVVLKVVNSEYPAPEELARYRREYAMTSRLQIDGVAQALSLEEIGNRIALVFTDIGGQSLADIQETTITTFSLPEFLPFAISITHTLDLVHRATIIHKDINSTNIIWNQETNTIHLIDFGISTELHRETQAVLNPAMLEGTLAYMSPEQTGRMNRVIDYRTDLYSLGVVFYQMLTGILPFSTSDPMELVHCHIARLPRSPHEVDPSIPRPLSAIIMKLLAKMAEDRYQNAIGLRADLQKCLENLAKKEEIEPFKPGEDDVSYQFSIPQKLYGRSQEIASLMKAFSKVANGALQMLLVAGYSGVGKSSLVQEVHKPIIENRGYFISGKFDQFQHDVPYLPIIQAFQKLVQQLLTESEQNVQNWKKMLTQSLGDEAGIITEVIPELYLITGKTKPVLQLSGNEARKRFNRVFIQFVKVFCSAQHPLVLFLDDLQWADPASLLLIQSVMSQQDGRYLLLIGAYRNNEVSSAHPLMLTLEEIEKLKNPATTLSTLHLEPLQYDDTLQLVSDTLNADTTRGMQLAELVQQKTGGNPFFISQLLTSLYEKHLLKFSHLAGKWEWNLERIHAIAISDNVADLLVDKIDVLPTDSQALLLLASCLGNQFDLATLAILSNQTPGEVVTQIWPAVQEEFIVPLHQAYKHFHSSDFSSDISDPSSVKFCFSHDRVQEAAYSKLSDTDKEATHLQAGRLLLNNTPEEKLDNHLFEIVSHLNYSIARIDEQTERDALASLNLQAGQKAKSSTAYKAALLCFTQGFDLLKEHGWECHPALMFNLCRERIECEFLCGNPEKAWELFRYTLPRTSDRLQKGKLYELMIRICHIGYDYAQGITLGKEALRLFSIDIPDNPEDYNRETESVLKYISHYAGDEQRISKLFDDREMEDENIIICSGIIHELWVCLFMSGHEQVLLPALILIRLSIEHGQSAITAVGHIFYALILSMQQDYDKAYAFGKLAMNLKEKYLNPLLAPKVHNTFCNFVNHYKNHIRTNIPIYEQSFRYCLQSGEIWWGAWAATFIRTARLVKGDPLDQVLLESKKYAEYILEAEFEPLIQVQKCQAAKLTNLMDLTGTRTSLDCESYIEEENVALMESMPFGLGLFWHHVYKAFMLFLYEENALALEAIMIAEENKVHIPGLMIYPDHFFFHTLIITANWPPQTSNTEAHLHAIHADLEQMRLWQNHCADNFKHRHLLMSAEYSRIQGNDLEAMDLYDKAIDEAGKNGYLHHEALANELAGKFYLSKNRKRAARGYLIEARYLYSRWGAKRKVNLLDEVYPDIAQSVEDIRSARTIASTRSSQVLDFNSVMKASQAISGEIVFEKLLNNLMTILMENGGAQKGYLLLGSNDELSIKAEGTLGKHEFVALRTTPITTLEPHTTLALSVVNYVIRTHKSVVLNDAANEIEFMRDAYITAHQPKSILCTPLLNQGKLDGLLYLENNLTPGAFTPDRIEALTLLSVQAAISIENATLYTTLERKVDERTAELVRANIALQAEVTQRKHIESALVDANKELHNQVSLDGLTQIANRRYLDDYLCAEWQRMRRENSPIAFLICDLDYFKEFNDTYGHLSGDDCLKKVARAMTQSIMRPADLVARYGGEEFVIVLPHSDYTGARHVAETLQRNISALQIPHSHSKVSKYVTLSIGIASQVPQPDYTSEKLLNDADKALYNAKNSGRNCIISDS